MGKTAFYRYEPVTEEDFRPLYMEKDAYAFPIKEDADEYIQEWIDWVIQLTSFEFHLATFIIITGEAINRCCDFADLSDGKKYPDDMTWVAFYLDEMEDADNFILENLFVKPYRAVDELMNRLFIEDYIEEHRKWVSKK